MADFLTAPLRPASAGPAAFVPFSGHQAEGPGGSPGEDFAGLLARSSGAASSPAGAFPEKLASPCGPRGAMDQKLYEQCEALESFLIKTLLSTMRDTVQKSGLIEEGFAGEMYEDMLYDEYAKDFTKNAKFGLAELAYQELTGRRGRMV